MSDAIRAEDLQRRWMHSHEEDSESEMVFRPASHTFPPSRGRTGFELRSDGSLVRIGIGPTDQPRSSPGRWSLERDVLQLEAAGGAEGSRSMRILSVTPDKLVVRR